MRHRAARGGLAGKSYVWGDEFSPQGKHHANTHQGRFPVNDTADDGHVVSVERISGEEEAED